MDLSWQLRIVEERMPGVLVLSLSGRLTAASADRFDAAIADALRRGDIRLVIDFERVDYISSRGLHILATGAQQCAAAGGLLVVCELTDPVRIGLSLGGLLPDLASAPTRQEAIARAAPL